MPKKFWQFRNAAEGAAELLLYGDIASEKSWYADAVTPKEFAQDLKDLGTVSQISVRINSGGGDVFAAQAMGNLLEANGAQVTAYIDGVCASAATIVACHCDKVVAARDSTYMIHPVQMGLFGYATQGELEQYIQALQTIRENILSLYAKKTGREKEEVAGWMDATSWWTGPQAQEKGFVDELTDNREDAVTVENRGGVLFVNAVSMGVKFEDTPFGNGEKEDPAGDPGAGGGASVNRESAGEPEKSKEERSMEKEIKTVEDLRGAYPQLVDQLQQEAAKAAAKAERERIQGIEDAALPGSEALAAQAKFEKPMSVSDFAVALVKNAKAQGASYLAQVERDAEESGANQVKNATPENQTKGDDFLAALRGLGK